MINGDTVAWLTPHAAVVAQVIEDIGFARCVVLLHLYMTVKIFCLGSLPSICGDQRVVHSYRLLASVVRSFVLYNNFLAMVQVINAPSL
jgi:hypothetical protein